MRKKLPLADGLKRQIDEKNVELAQVSTRANSAEETIKTLQSRYREAFVKKEGLVVQLAASEKEKATNIAYLSEKTEKLSEENAKLTAELEKIKSSHELFGLLQVFDKKRKQDEKEYRRLKEVVDSVGRLRESSQGRDLSYVLKEIDNALKGNPNPGLKD
jgi:chromosome segregation ATPase